MDNSNNNNINNINNNNKLQLKINFFLRTCCFVLTFVTLVIYCYYSLLLKKLIIFIKYY